MTPCIRLSAIACVVLLVAASASQAQTAASATSSTLATPGTPATSAPGGGDLDEIVINGIKRGDLILPTQVSSKSAFGLDLGVMETPRNNTLLSKAQLDALNIQNPGGFSYLTSSSYSDAAFGQPAVPRIRGQYADMFFNGMRESFSDNGYGAPVSFNSADSIDIVKGPASVQAGPGPGVGGAIDITTKMPSFNRTGGTYDVEVDSQQKRRAAFDVGGPLTSTLAGRVSFTSDDSGSYYNDMYFHQQALYVALLAQVTPAYSVWVSADVADTRYRENDGVNRVNQDLIDHGTYLTGAAAGPIYGYGTEVDLTGSSGLSDRVLIDETPGTGAHSLHGRGQIIQNLTVSDDFSISNNTFYDYINRYNETQEYYADSARGSYTIENKTDFSVKFGGAVKQQIDAGFTFRFAHLDDIQNESNEPVSVYDLTQSPLTWQFPPGNQASGGAVPYVAAFGRIQYGVSGRTPFFLNNSVISNLKDGAVFLEHRFQFSPQWSLLYGLRGDLVQLNEADPLGGPGLVNGLPQKESTNWYGLYNGNLSLVYSPSSHVSAYLTYNKSQYVDPDANDGTIGTFGVDPASQLRQGSLLEEAGMKFDLLDKALFISTAIFKQERAIPAGPGGVDHSFAHIRGAEIELNYQPDPHFFATASYSYLHTTLDTGVPFWNFPAQVGANFDGAAADIVWKPNQTFLDPGVPEHLFNVLANYKMESGLGFQGNVQVTGPIETTQSGYIDVGATEAASGLPVPDYLVANGGNYQSPKIPWQYTLNAATFYSFQKYTIKFEIYNLTDQHNLVNDFPFYGNDFLTRVPPRSYDLTFSGKF